MLTLKICSGCYRVRNVHGFKAMLGLKPAHLHNIKVDHQFSNHVMPPPRQKKKELMMLISQLINLVSLFSGGPQGPQLRIRSKRTIMQVFFFLNSGHTKKKHCICQYLGFCITNRKMSGKRKEKHSASPGLQPGRHSAKSKASGRGIHPTYPQASLGRVSLDLV